MKWKLISPFTGGEGIPLSESTSLCGVVSMVPQLSIYTEIKFGILQTAIGGVVNDQFVFRSSVRPMNVYDQTAYSPD